MDARTTTSGHAADDRGRTARSPRRPPSALRRPGLYLAVATAGAVLVNVLGAADPAEQPGAGPAETVSVAQQLDMTARSGPADGTQDLRLLEQLGASRSSREAAQTVAQQLQVTADQAERDRRQAEADAAARAAEAIAAQQATEAAAAAEAAAAQRAATAAAPSSAARAGAAPAAAVAGAIARISNSTGNVRPSAQAAANQVVSNVPGAAALTIGGTRASATDPDGHPSGLALDYMVLSDDALGDAIAQYQIDHWAELGVEYVIWQQRMLSSPTGSWQPMADRGSATANHYDHVHVNHRP
jgi:hypothetical protein